MINRDSQNTIDIGSDISDIKLLNQRLLIQQESQKKKQKKQIQIQNNQSPVKQRLLSLDVYRGLTVMGMLVGNNGGSNTPPYLDHPQWDGLTPIDFIAPSFLFIVGFAVPLSVNEKNPIKLKNFIRIIAIFLIGMFINLTEYKFSFDHIQIMGTLQRISVCYALILILHYLTRYGKINYRIHGFLVVMVLQLIYVAGMLSFDKPEIGCPKQINLTKKCNFASYWDKKILNQSFQPQGLFSTLTAFASTYFGYLFCLIFKDNKKQLKKTLIQWLIISCVVGLGVYPLTFIMPFNSHICSINFEMLAIFVSGVSISFFVFFLDVYLINKNRSKRIVFFLMRPLVWLGKNPLIVYVLMYQVKFILNKFVIIGQRSFWRWIQVYVFNTWIQNIVVASVMFSCLMVVFWTIFAGILHYKKIFIKL